MTRRADWDPGEDKDHWSADEQFLSAASELESYGLRLNQARIYLFLLVEGASTARMLSTQLKLHRVDVYRNLRELAEMGILEVHLKNPRTYASVDHRSAVATLVSRREEGVLALRGRSKDMIARIGALHSSLRSHPLAPAWSTPDYKLVVGRSRYYSEMKETIRDARKEVLKIISAGGVTRAFYNGLAREYANAKSRGVPVRMIAEVKPANLKYAKRLAKIVTLRHLSDIHLRFTVVDGSVTFLSASPSPMSMSLESPIDTYLMLEDPRLAEALRSFFEHLWKIAKPLGRSKV
jgi:sugar-specific transcriptional regulator TrmB